MFDFKMLSTIGFTDEDIDELAKRTGCVVEGSYSVDCSALMGDKDATDTVRFISITQNVNHLSLESGRLPSRPDEVVIDAYRFPSVELGTKLVITDETSEQSLNMFKYREYTIVGTARSPLYLNFQRGTSNEGSGSVSYYVCALPGAFDSEYYTEAYLYANTGTFTVFSSNVSDTSVVYRPMIEDGKVWKVGSTRGVSDGVVKMVDYYYLNGDTIIDGKTCKKMMCKRYVSPEHPDYDALVQEPLLRNEGAWYEEDKKVYVYDTISNQFQMKYDFSSDSNDTLMIDNHGPFVIGPKRTGGLAGFKGVYRDIIEPTDEGDYFCTTWLEGVGGIESPLLNTTYAGTPRRFMVMSCTVGDEVIYLNDDYEDGASIDAAGARKDRFDFVHIIKPRPKVPSKQEESDASIMAKAPSKESEEPIYGEYNELQLDINLNPLADAYMVSITNEAGKAVYEKAINAGSIVGLNIDISAYAKGRYTVTMENSLESFTGEFEVQTTGIEEVIDNNKVKASNTIFNLQGQRISSLQKGLNIVNGRKVVVK